MKKYFCDLVCSYSSGLKGVAMIVLFKIPPVQPSVVLGKVAGAGFSPNAIHKANAIPEARPVTAPYIIIDL